jgi:tetratricopeptide (TPR) repeat protein
MEISELRLSVENYPTDLALKFELGKRYAALGEHDEAIGLLQEAKNDARYRGQALALLGSAFRAMDWNDEAVATYRQALESASTMSEDLRLELTYGLLCALQAKADRERDLGAAEEAEKLASAIAIENFSYRDIRPRRENLKKLVLALKQGG